MRQLAVFFIFFILLVTPAVSQNDSTKTAQSGKSEDIILYEKLLNSEMEQMLNSYYVKREQANAKSILTTYTDDMEAVTDESADMDSIYKMRLKKINTIVQLSYTPAVRSYIELYTTKRKRSSSALLGLAQHYYPMMKQIFDKYNLPEELVYITIIESSLNPEAVSPAGATGIWQFMYTTGKTYGLQVNSFIDDRRDPIKATEAAARHFRDLYNIFGDWGLAISAYNCGAGNVRKAITRSGGKNNFWDIRPFLPKETQNYFPAYIGAYYMMKYYKQHGITPAKISIPTDIDTVMVKKEVHFEQIAHVLNIDVKEIETLNPQYKRKVIPAFDTQYPLTLRHKDLMKFIALEDSIYKYEYDQYFAPLQMYVNAFTGKTTTTAQTTKKYHTVKSGETLAKISNKYGLSVEELKKMNKLKSNYVKTGQKLVVGYITPKPETPKKEEVKSEDNKEGQAEEKSQTEEKPAPKTEYTIHVVKAGESLTSIANKYHVSYKKIAQDNNIKNINNLIVGQKLKIYR